MKKLLALVFAIVMVMSLCLSACAKKEEPAETVPETTETVEAFTQAETEAETEAVAEVEKPTLIHPLIEMNYQGAQNDDNEFVYELYWPVIKLEGDEETAFSKLEKALEKSGLWYRDEAFENREWFIETFNDSKEIGFPADGLTSDTKALIKRSDSNYFSYETETYFMGGGAHPTYTFWAHVYDSKDGSELPMSKVVTDKDKLISEIRNVLMTDYADVDYFDLDDSLAHYELDPVGDTTEKFNFTWSLSYDGIRIYFNQYELAPYASGYQIVDLKFDDYPDLFVDDVKNVPDSYGTYLDFDYDDNYNQLQVIEMKSDKGDYIYKVHSMDDDENMIEAYSADGGTMIGMVPGGDYESGEERDVEDPPQDLWVSQRVRTYHPLVDPDKMTTAYFDKSADEMTEINYYVGDEGKPEELTK